MAAGAPTHEHCPQCGAELNDSRCWLCGWSPAVGDRYKTPAGGTTVSSVGVTPRAEPRPFQFSISGVLVFTAVIAVCLGAFRVAPGLGILLAIVGAVSLVPAAIRSSAAAQLEPGARSFWTSFAVSAAAITVGIIACGISAFTAIFLGCSMGAAPRDSSVRALLQTVIMVFLFGSPIIGLLVSGLTLWLTWPKRK